MKLDVLPSANPDAPWYTDGLKFTCAQCGNCCTGGPGYVWISAIEVGRLAAFLNLTPRQVIEKYCRQIDGRYSLKEIRRGDNYDCIFLSKEKAAPGKGDRVVHTKRGCSIYPVRPLQCRTWPFWPENLRDPKAWEKKSKNCYGMNHGRKFSAAEIAEIRDAKDWPVKPPTSSAK